VPEDNNLIQWSPDYPTYMRLIGGRSTKTVMWKWGGDKQIAN